MTLDNEINATGHLKVWHCCMLYWELGWRDMKEKRQLAGSQVA